MIIHASSLGFVKIYSPTGENAILLLDKAVRRFGAPKQILTDQGTQFKPARWSLSGLRSTGASYATTTTPGHTKE